MSFLFEPVSAAIQTLKLIKSASTKGPDPNRFVTRVPPNPGKWALGTAFKRRHNLWKWTHYLPAKVPRKQKTKKQFKLRIVREDKGEDEVEIVGGSAGSWEAAGVDDAAGPGGQPVKLPPLVGSKASFRTRDASEQAMSTPSRTEQSSDRDEGERRGSRSVRMSSAGSTGTSPGVDEDGMPYFPIPDDEEAESEAKRLAEMSPEQRVYYRSCEHFKVKALRQIMKQIDSVEIMLAHTKMRDLEFKAFTAGIVMNFAVKRLDLTDTVPSERQMTYLNDFLEDDNGITDLILKDNRLEGRVIARMFESMGQRDVMVYLDISGNNIRDKDLPLLARYIESSSQLSYLYMARNKFTSKAGDPLGKMMVQSTLIDLDVSANQLRGDGMAAFLNSVARCTTLERLDVSWNGIGPEAVRAVCNLLRQNTSIISLDLTGTRINGECLDMICTQGLAKNGVLQKLELKNNPLLTQDLTTFLTKIYSFPATLLRRVDLGDYQMLEAGAAPVVEALFWEKNIYIRTGPVFTYSKRTDTVENIVQRFRKDALGVVTRLDQSERAALVKHFAMVDMEEAMETGGDILSTSFLGRVNEKKVTYRDLALRITLEGGVPIDVIHSVLEKEQIAESSKRMVSRFSISPEDVRKIHLLARTG